MTFALGSQSALAVEIVREVPVNPGTGPYTIAPDGTVWQIGQTSGVVNKLDPETGAVEDSFTTFSTNAFFQSLGFHNGRVFVMDTPKLYSWDTTSDDDSDPGRVTSDLGSDSRFGTVQAILRVSGDTAAVALGQINKVGIVSLTDLDATNPFYPQSWFGAGINDFTGQANAFQACVYTASGPVIGEPENCGQGAGKSGTAPGQFGYAIDTAAGSGGIYVLEYLDNEVSFILLNQAGCPCPSFKFGSGPGIAAGDLNQPFSIRRVPANGHLLISNAGNRRIDEFTAGGDYLRSFGFGVRTGANQFQVCGGGIGPCQAGVQTTTEPRSNFTQLDIVDGELYAATPSDNSIQVISLDGGPTGYRVSLSATPTKVKKGKRTTLAAKLRPCQEGDKARFQRKSGGGFDSLGGPVAANDDCKATKKVRITRKSVFRAISIDSAANTLATSRNVTVKLK